MKHFKNSIRKKKIMQMNCAIPSRSHRIPESSGDCLIIRNNICVHESDVCEIGSEFNDFKK